MEQALGDSGYDPGPVDGVIDNQTREAVRVFQEDHSLVATGFIDPATGELLGVVIVNRANLTRTFHSGSRFGREAALFFAAQ